MIEHGARAYRKKICRCKQICTPAHATLRREERAAGRQLMNSGRTAALRFVDDVLFVNENQARILNAWLLDGAEPETVARRVRLAVPTVQKNLTAIRQVTGLDTRLELAVALLRRAIEYRVHTDETSTSSETLEQKEEHYGRYPTWPRATAG